MKKFVKRYIIIAVVVIAAIVIASWMFNNSKMASNTMQVAEMVSTGSASGINVGVLTEDLRSIGELATVEYLYTDAAWFVNSNQIFGHDVPLTEKSFLAKWDGAIKAGIDVSRLRIEVDEDEKILTISIPPAYITSHEIFYDTFEVLNEKDGLFNNITVTDSNSVIEESKKAMEQRALDNGLLDNAADNAKTLINSFLEYDARIADYAFNLTDDEE